MELLPFRYNSQATSSRIIPATAKPAPVFFSTDHFISAPQFTARRCAKLNACDLAEEQRVSAAWGMQNPSGLEPWRLLPYPAFNAQRPHPEIRSQTRHS